ncbi:MAG: FHA domain-containing protein [Acidimicrobiales bacterium]
MIGPFLESQDGERIAVANGSIVGRVGDGQKDRSIVFDVAAVSRRHAEFTQRSSSWWLQDLASKNGTYVNGEALGNDALCLADGDMIVFAGSVTVRFHDPAATPIAPRIGRLVGVWLDEESDAVWVDATRIEPPLSARQLALLKLLDANADEVVSRISIVAEVWSDVAADGVSDEAVAALVKRLRARLREGPQGTEYIDVIKGRGIRLRRPE